MLNKSEINSARPAAKAYTLSDIRGLHIQIMPTGRKFWRMRYAKSDGKMSWHTIGEYPVVSIDEARDKTHALQKRLKDGLPLVDVPPPAPSFSEIAEKWLAANDERPITIEVKRCIRSQVNRYVMPSLGSRPINKITPPDVLAILQRIQEAGRTSVVVNVKGYISQIFRYAAARGLVSYDPIPLLRGAIRTEHEVKHRASLTNSEEIGTFLRALDAYPYKCSRLALTFAIYTMTRPSEARTAEWSEIDMERREWRIPAEKMKKRRPHIVPLSDQLMEILEAMRAESGNGRYVFRNFRNSAADTSPLNEKTFWHAIKRIGYAEIVTPHGFRSMASTILNENGFNRDWIERQLAHAERNRSRAAYNYADYLDDRRTMLQWYADHLDSLRGGKMSLEKGKRYYTRTKRRDAEGGEAQR